MSDVFTKYGYDKDAATWSIEIDTSDYIGFFGVDFLKGISPGAFNRSTHKTVAAPSDSGDDNCASPHMRNSRYVSAASATDDGEVSIDEAAAVLFTPTYVDKEDCTLRISYTDDAPLSTVMENNRFFAYDGSNVNNPPDDITTVAAEYEVGTPDQINKDRDSDVPGDKGAWDADGGIGGVANALILSDRLTPTATHYFYLFLSVSPLAKGQQTGKYRFESDIS